MTKLNYIPVLLHSHTQHSDGHFTSEELLMSAKLFGYKAIFITDHNTDAALDEVYENNLDKKIIPVYYGIEWTTFYGHMLILASKDAGNYTRASLTNMEEIINEIKKENPQAIFSINHPFDMGNPICTGCHYEFNIKDYSKFAYIELINGENSEDSKATKLAYKFWKKLLDEGYSLAALAGRDWHLKSRDDDTVPINMIGINGPISEDNIIDAIRNNRSYISYGPILNIEMGDTQLGGQIPPGDFRARLSIEKGNFKNTDYIELIPEKLLVFNNNNLVFEKEISYNKDISLDIFAKEGYIRFEILGKMKDKDNIRLLITSVIFVR